MRVCARALMAGVVSVVVMSAGGQAADALPTPEGLAVDTSVWPNVESWRNSDPWLAEHHGEIREMRPRVMVVNFANGVGMEEVRRHAEGVVAALAESTRWHGYEEERAPAFLRYEVVRYVDLRDGEVRAPEARTSPDLSVPDKSPSPQGGGGPEDARPSDGNSSLFPRKTGESPDVACDYAGLYTEGFARLLGFEDPREEDGYLDLHELINAGCVHELWMYLEHDGPWPALEVIELKQKYDDARRPIAGEFVPAGNGHDETMPWSGRTFRIAFFNPRRGVGCALENLAHGLEWNATSGAVPYFGGYFREYAELNLDERYGVPFDSLYRTRYGQESIAYAGGAMEVRVGRATHRIEPYVAVGGNAHFPPGAREHYDIASPVTVMSTIEHYRRGGGTDGADLAAPFSAAKFAAFETVAPDCMGRWLVFWRQCMPGLESGCVDDEGRAMLNWWAFLFY